MLLRRFFLRTPTVIAKRFRYGSKEVADDCGLRDRFFSSGQFLANEEQARDVFGDRLS